MGFANNISIDFNDKLIIGVVALVIGFITWLLTGGVSGWLEILLISLPAIFLIIPSSLKNNKILGIIFIVICFIFIILIIIAISNPVNIYKTNQWHLWALNHNFAYKSVNTQLNNISTKLIVLLFYSIIGFFISFLFFINTPMNKNKDKFNNTNNTFVNHDFSVNNNINLSNTINEENNFEDNQNIEVNFCQNCGLDISNIDSNYCPRCGSKI